MRLIGEGMQGGARSLVGHFDNMWRNQNSAKRRISAGNSLPGKNNVWLEVPMLAGKWFPGAAHAGHYLIGNHQDPTLAANLRDARRVAIDRRRGTERCTHHWFENKCGNAGCIIRA